MRHAFGGECPHDILDRGRQRFLLVARGNDDGEKREGGGRSHDCAVSRDIQSLVILIWDSKDESWPGTLRWQVVGLPLAGRPSRLSNAPRNGPAASAGP